MTGVEGIAWKTSLWVAVLAGGLMLMAAHRVSASPVEVVMVDFQKSGDRWYVNVTLRHADTGWDHYANVWVVETLDGKELGRRVLTHPHEDEQPFTRGEMLTIPPGITRVQVRAGDNVEGINSNTVVVDLTQSRGDRFRVH